MPRVSDRATPETPRRCYLLLVDLLQLLLVPLQLLLQHLHLSRQVVSRRLVSIALLCPGLEILERGFVTFILVFRDLEPVLEGGDLLFFLQEVLLELMDERDTFELG
jgi:hypothetical protein